MEQEDSITANKQMKRDDSYLEHSNTRREQAAKYEVVVITCTMIVTNLHEQSWANKCMKAFHRKQIPWQHLQQNVSMLYDHIHELYSVYTKISAIELNVSQVNANSTNLQLLNLAFALSELQHDLDSTT